jgi:hypothetical protein
MLWQDRGRNVHANSDDKGSTGLRVQSVKPYDVVSTRNNAAQTGSDVQEYAVQMALAIYATQPPGVESETRQKWYIP